MKRRSFLSTVLGGLCAAIWPWKTAEAVEPVYHGAKGPFDGFEPRDEPPGPVGIGPPPQAYMMLIEAGPTRLDRGDYFEPGRDGRAQSCRKEHAIGIITERIEPHKQGMAVVCEQMMWRRTQGKATITDGTQPDSLAD